MVHSELLQYADRLQTEMDWIKVAKYFEKTDSTQKRANQFLTKEADGAVLIIAETQSKGQGRLGRPWVSPVGGVWLTLALPSQKLELKDLAPYSLVASLTVAQSLKEVNALDCKIKWPNDVLYEGKKLGGILLSTVTKYKKTWLLVGIGINVNNDLPAELKDTATSIKAIRGQTQGRSRLIESILTNLWEAWSEFDRTGFGPYKNAFENFLTGVGEATTISIGKKSLSGTLVGIDPRGALLLKSGPDTQTVQAGEIVV